MKASRTIPILLILFMITSLLAACTQTPEPVGTEEVEAGEEPASEATEAVAEEIDPLGKYEPSIVVSLSGEEIDPNSEPIDGQTETDNAWLTAYEDELGITFEEYWVVTTDRVEEKTNLAIASGDIPDLLYLSSREQFEMAVEDGLAADLTEAYEKYASDLTKAMLSSDGGKCLEMASVNGKLMAIPWSNGFVDRTPVLWLRGDWLTNLGLEVPTTMEELEVVLDAFVNQDPDGNGENDTVGFATSMTLDQILSVFNGFHSYPTSWIMDDDGTIVYGGIQPETKDALATLADWFEKGYIHSEFGAMSVELAVQQLAAGQAGAVTGLWWYVSYPLNYTHDLNPAADWVSVPFVSADSDPALPLASYGPEGYYVVRNDYENPEAIIKMVNLWFEKMYGESADITTYNKTMDGQELFWFSKVIAWPSNEDYNAFLKIREALETGDTSELLPLELVYFGGVSAFLDGDESQYTLYKMYGPESANGSLEYYVSNDYFMFDEYYGSGTETMNEKQASLDKLLLETFVKIIMGELELDAFDDFVEQWNEQGGAQITQEVNEWYQNK